MKRVHSADNPGYRQLLKLAQSSRERRKAGLSLLDGIHLVAAYHARFGRPAQIVVSESALGNAEIRRLLEALHPLVPLVLTDALFAALSTVSTPTGIMAAIATPRAPVLPEKLEACVLLDDIQDPGNLGSILRTAAAAGINQVCLSKTSVHAWSPRVLRAGMGAHFMLDIHEQCDLAALIRNFSGRVIVTTLNAPETVFGIDLTGPVALLFGNEGAGVSQDLCELAHQAVGIPMAGGMESLNVGAAVAICLFERMRQLQQRAAQAGRQ